MDRGISPSFVNNNCYESNSPCSPSSIGCCGALDNESPSSPINSISIENYVGNTSSGPFSTQCIPNNFTAFSLLSSPLFRTFPQTQGPTTSALIDVICSNNRSKNGNNMNESSD